MDERTVSRNLFGAPGRRYTVHDANVSEQPELDLGDNAPSPISYRIALVPPAAYVF